MLSLESMIELLVALLLGAVIVYCAILDRRLAAVRAGQDALRDLLGQLTAATDTAERAVFDLRIAADASGAELSEKNKVGRALADELAILIESSSAVAARLERARTDLTPSQPSLLKSLREAR